MSTRSSSESSPLGVPVTISGAITEMELSLPGRFSLPPTREGRTALDALPEVVVSSGVSEFLRLVAAVDVRGRFWPAVDFGRVADFGVGAVDFWNFLVGASGCGHSTSCERSRRDAGTHSVIFGEGLMMDEGSWTYHRDVC